MIKAIKVYGVSLSKQLAFTALFAALCFVGTYVVTIPAPSGGYLNVGDVFVLLSGWFLGPLYGTVAAAVGSAITDLIVFPIYAPATFIIKAADALVAYLLWAFFKKLIKKDALDFIPRAIGAIVGEALMVFGYALYDFFLGAFDFSVAIANMPFNLIQAAVCFAGALALIAALYQVKPVKKFFPFLEQKKEAIKE